MSDLKLDDVTSILDDEEKPAFRPLSVDDVNSAIMDLSAERTQRSVFEGVQKNPDTYAKDRKTADRAGLPVDAVEYDRTTVENSLKIEDVMGALGEAPVTSAFMQDRDNAAIAHDDVQNLTMFENIASGLGERAYDAAVGFNDVVDAVSSAVDAPRRAISNSLRGILGFEQEPEMPGLATAITDLADALVGNEVRTRDVRAIDLGYEEMTSWQEVKDQPLRNFVPFALEQGLMSVPDMALAIVSMPAFTASMVGRIAEDRAQADGRAVPTVGDMVKAAPFAVASAFLERLGARGILGMDDALKTLGPKAVLGAAGKGAVKEGATEFIQEGLEYAGGSIGTEAGFDPAQALDQMAAGLVAGGGFGGSVRLGTATVENVFKAKRATANADLLREANQTALQSKLNDRDPERAGLHRAEVLRAKGIESVAIDAEAANTFFQSALLEDPEFADRLGITEEGLAEALAMGGDIEIGVDAFARHLYGTPAFDQIADHVRLGPDAMTAAEAMQYEETGLQDEIARFEDSIAAMEDGPRQAADVISQEVEQMMLEAGQEADTARFAGVLLASEYSTVAERAGIDALALWRQDRVSILGPDAATDTTVDELSILLDKARSGSDAETFLELSKTPMLDELKARGGVDPNGPLGMELKALDLPAQMKRGLFKEGGLQSADNIPQNEVGLFADDDFGEDMNGYIPPDAIIEAVRAEIAGEPKRTGTQQADVEAFNAGVNDLTQALDEAGLTLDSPDADIRAALEGRGFEQPAYHGSPYIFVKFSTDNIGTGEGAQAYGWGLYFAGKKEVAEYYRRMLTPSYQGSQAYGYVQDALSRTSNRQEALEYLNDKMKEAFDTQNTWEARFYQDAVNNFDDLAKSRPGRLYEVEIPDDGEYLLWDKPLSEQPEKVREALKKVAQDSGGQMSLKDSVETVEAAMKGDANLAHLLTDKAINIDGNDIYRKLERQPHLNPAFKLGMRSDQAASKALAEAGIPGIKYLDGSSRGDGDGTYNYVIFDDKLVDIRSFEQPEGVGFGPRGSISFDAKETVIRMYQAADRSTFLHEAGHLFLEHVKRNSDRWGLRNPQFTEDWDTVRKWWGDNAESLRAEAIKYARQQKDEAAVTALGKMSEKEVRDYVTAGNLTGTAFEQAPTQTDAFKNWFGDSKVVDKRGKPLVVYHGTPDKRGLEAFDRTESETVITDQARYDEIGEEFAGLESGSPEYMALIDERLSLTQSRMRTRPAFFTNSRRVASTYADETRAFDYQNAEGGILQVYLSIQNPLVIDAKGESWGKRGGPQAQEEQIQAAKAAGHDGIIIRNTLDTYNVDGRARADVYVSFSPEQVKSVDNRGTFDPNDPRILYQGRTGIIPDSDPHGYLTRAMHEQWARSSEDYFKSGQAPSVGLQDAFNRFRAWLVSIYNRLSGRGTLDVRFSEPVRRVMDRLLATDEEIALVEEQYNLKALFASAEEAGMTPAQWAAYQRETARAAEDAKTRQLKKHLREIEREQLQWWKEESQRVRETEVEPEIQAQPVYKALYALARGSMPDGSEIPGGLRPSRLDRKAVVAVLENEESLSRLPKVGRTGILATGKEQGAHPDVIASLYGYADGRAMLLDLMNAKPMEQAIRDTVEARMKERHGDLTQHSQATEAALESAHADKRGDVLAMELNALRESGPKMKPAFVRQWARERIATQKVGQIQPQRYLAAERKHAREAGKLLRQGDRLGAQRAKFKQLLNFYMAKEAYAERDRIEKDRRYMSKFNRVKKTFKAIDPDYVDKIRKILAIHELGPRLSDKKALVLEMKALNDWIQAKQQDDGAILEIPPQILAANEKTHYRDMTLEDFRALADTIRNIEAQGRLKKEALVNKETRLIDDMAGEIVERLDRKPVKARAARKARFQNTGTADRVIGKLASFDAALRKVEFLLEWIDGEKGGPAHRYIFQSFADAETARNDLTKAVTAKIMGALDAIPKKIRERLAEKVDVPELGRTFRRSDLLMMALNTGNESNLTKMIEGSAKDVAPDAQAWTQEGIDAALANLIKEEWDFVQTVWDSFEAMYPEVEAIYRRENGVAPEKIEPREIETRFGTYKGGYFPMMYDPERSAQARDLENKSALEAMQSSIVKGSVNSSMTKARTGFSAPVLLNIEALPNHIERTAHFITHYEAVRTVRKLLARPELARAMENRLGPESTETLRQWVNEIASNGQPTAPTSVVGRLVEAMRTNATVAIMGFSYTTGASQMLGYSQSIDALAQQPDGSYKPHKGAKWVLQGLVQYLRDPAETKRWVYEASGEMRHRFENTDRDIRHGMKKLAGKSGAWKQMQRFSLMAIAGVQLYTVDFPTWVGAYNKGLAEGRSTDDAVKYADSVLRTSQSAGGLKDLSAIQREPGVTRAFTMFYSFFNVLYNLEAQALGRAKGVRDVPQLAARAAILLALPVAAEALLRNEWPDDDEDYAEWLGLRAAVYAFSSVPLLRDMVGMTEGFGYSLSPLDSFGESLGKSVRDIAKAADEGEMSASGWKAVVSAFGFGFGAPATAVNRIIDAADAMQEGEDVGPYDFLVGFKE